MTGPPGGAEPGVLPPFIDQSTAGNLYSLGEPLSEPARTHRADAILNAEKGSAFYNKTVRQSLTPSDITKVADLSRKGNGSDVIKSKCDLKATLIGRSAGKATVEEALAAFHKASDPLPSCNASFRYTSMLTHYPRLIRCSGARGALTTRGGGPDQSPDLPLPAVPASPRTAPPYIRPGLLQIVQGAARGPPFRN